MKPPKKRLTRGEKASARVELESIKNPWSGDAGFESFQSSLRKEERPVRRALKDIKLEWKGRGLSFSQDKGEWSDLNRAMQEKKPDDNFLKKAAKDIARVTPIATLASAAASGTLPYLIYPSLSGSKRVVEAISNNARGRREERRDVKILAKANRPNASLSEQKRGETVRSKYEKRGEMQEQRDMKKYGVDVTTYGQLEPKKLKKK